MRTPPLHVAILSLLVALIAATTAKAHPLGNGSITHFNVLYILPDRLEVDLLLDIAETPAQSIRRDEIDLDRDNRDTEEERQVWLNKQAVEYAPFLKAKINGQPITLQPLEEAYDRKTGEKAKASRMIAMIPGFAHMPTYRLLIRYGGAYAQPLNAGEHTIHYEDTTYPQDPGLKRILLEQTPDVECFAPRPSFWNEGPDPFLYEQYDPNKLPQERSTSVRFRLTRASSSVTTQPAVEASAPEAPSAALPAASNIIESFTDPRNNPAQTEESFRQATHLIGLLQGRWGLAMILAVTGLSFAWGAAHALMPGHAKTVVAAYLISQHGSYRHAVILAFVVTVTHTALVVLLGVFIWFYQDANPTLGPRLQLWLGLTAGVLVAIMGASLVWRALTGRLAHHHHDHDHHTHEPRSWFKTLFTHSHPHVPGHMPSHSHDHHHHHHHEHQHHHSHEAEHGAGSATHSHPHDHSHTHTHDHHHEHDHVHAKPLSTSTLLLLGITGGIVPCPTAMIIMLLGIGANVVVGALYAVGVFSLGLAVTLMVIGFLALSSRRFAGKLLMDAKHEGELSGLGQKLMLQIIPGLSGALVVALGFAITAHYVNIMKTGRPLFPWLG